MLGKRLLTLSLASTFSLLANAAAFAQEDEQSNPLNDRKHWRQELLHLEDTVESLKVQIALLSEKAVHTEAILEKAEAERAQSFARQDAMGVSAVSYDDVLRLLQTQKVQLAIELAGIDARREALLDASEKAAKERSKASRPMIGRIERLLADQADQVERVRQLAAQGAISESDVHAAERELAELEFRLEEAKTAADSGDFAFENHLLETSLQHVELSARLSIVESLLAEYANVRKTMMEAADADRQVDEHRVHLTNLKASLQNAEAQLQEVLARRKLLENKLESAGDDSKK